MLSVGFILFATACTDGDFFFGDTFFFTAFFAVFLTGAFFTAVRLETSFLVITEERGITY